MAALENFFDNHSLEHSVLIGYYGGGNYGDELLLEILANDLHGKGVQDLTIAYQNPEQYQRHHHDFGYQLLPTSNKKQLLQAIRKSHNIIVGGGGLWGLDMNLSVFLFSLLLFIAGRLLGKNVFLLGVGYYNSTSRLGRMAAWLAGKGSAYIIVRDEESLKNFQKITHGVDIDQDLAWRLPKLKLAAYKDDFTALDRQLVVAGKTLFITLRRFRPHQKNTYTRLIETYLANNREKPIIVALMEPRDVDPDSYELVRDWQRQHKNVQVIDFSYNPFALFMFFVRHHKNLAVIAPQFHTILTAHLAKVPFLPLSYDNKVADLLDQLGKSGHVAINQLQIRHLQAFTGAFYQEAKGP